jgi:hypothetical protein
VEDALIYGGDEAGKEVVTAVILPKSDDPNAVDEDDNPIPPRSREEIIALLEEAIDEINEKLPVYKQIASVKFRTSPFEKTTSRKIKRNKENTTV